LLSFKLFNKLNPKKFDNVPLSSNLNAPFAFDSKKVSFSLFKPVVKDNLSKYSLFKLIDSAKDSMGMTTSLFIFVKGLISELLYPINRSPPKKFKLPLTPIP
jgi:hypothetical protein